MDEARRRPRALSLDFDDTIIDNSVIPENIRQTCVLVAARYPFFDAAALFETNARCWAKYWAEVEKECWLGGLTVQDVSREAWRRTFVACGSDDPAVVDLAFETSQELDRQRRRAFPDVAELLARARELAMPIALVTNGPSGLQRDRLRSLQLDDAFDPVVISAEVGVAKPDPAIFRLTARELGADPSDLWHVGDNLLLDVGGAEAAGVTSVWLNRDRRSRDRSDPTPDLEVQSLRDLASYLAAT